MLVTSLVFMVIFYMIHISHVIIVNCNFFTTVHNVTTCPSTEYVVTLHGENCYITVLRQ
jgi:hypothetical protein